MPVSEFWDRYALTFARTVDCGVNAIRFFIGNSIPNLLTDAAILVLPIPFVWKLHLPHLQRMTLSSIFLVGALYAEDSIDQRAITDYIQ